jgi:hypothetical protein
MIYRMVRVNDLRSHTSQPLIEANAVEYAVIFPRFAGHIARQFPGQAIAIAEAIPDEFVHFVVAAVPDIATELTNLFPDVSRIDVLMLLLDSGDGFSPEYAKQALAGQLPTECEANEVMSRAGHNRQKQRDYAGKLLKLSPQLWYIIRHWLEHDTLMAVAGDNRDEIAKAMSLSVIS